MWILSKLGIRTCRGDKFFQIFVEPSPRVQYTGAKLNEHEVGGEGCAYSRTWRNY